MCCTKADAMTRSECGKFCVIKLLLLPLLPRGALLLL
jgi:hypothetical protein